MNWEHTAVALALLGSGFASAQEPLFEGRHRMLPRFTQSTTDSELGDVDGDGDLDVFFTSQPDASPKYWLLSGLNRLHLNDGKGRFLDASERIPAHEDFSRAAAMGDIEGDGDLDIVVGNTGMNRTYTNDGSGFFTDAPHPDGSHDSTIGVVLGDADGDGDLDLFVANVTLDRFFRNDGLGGFSDAGADWPAVAGATFGLALADVDSDGHVDVVAGGDSGAALFLGSASGVFVDASSQLPLDPENASVRALGDVDGDTDVDIVLADRLYRNDGMANFVLDDAAVPEDSKYAVLADLEGDGDLDLIAGGGPFLNDGQGAFSVVAWESPLHPQGSTISCGDLDADGDLDAVLGMVATTAPELVGYNQLILGSPSGVLIEATEIEPSLPEIFIESRAIASGDLDADGDLDIAVALYRNEKGGDYDEKIGLYLNSGGGFFVDASAQLPIDVTPYSEIGTADVDGDDDLDIVAVGSTVADQGGGVRILLNDGEATFTTGAEFGSGFWNVVGFALADVDADGDEDILLSNYPSFVPAFPTHELWLNDGTGEFTSVTGAFPASGELTFAIATADLDGDGDFDALFGNSSSLSGPDNGQNNLMLYSGGVFQEAVGALPTALDATYAWALGDLNGNGLVDALAGNNGANGYYANLGGGSFADASDLLPNDSYLTSGIALGDVDEDGDLDALLATTWSANAETQLYINDGMGEFADASHLLPPGATTTEAVLFADVDGDHDLDAFLARSGLFNEFLTNGRRGLDGLWHNRTRHLAWRSVPAIDAHVTFDLCGPVGSPFAIFYSPIQVAPINVGFGSLLLDPLRLFVATSGTLTTACDSVELFVPNLPALVGETFYLQAVYAAPLGLSNLERLPIAAH